MPTHDAREQTTDSARRSFVFLLVPGLSMMSLASAIEPLRSLNRLAGREAYQWRLASLDGSAGRGLERHPAARAAATPALDGADYLFVCGGLRIKQADEKRYLAVLRQAARRGIAVGSLSTGTYLLARAGLLAGYRCTIHWENRSAFQEDFPDLDCTNKIYEIDRDRLTCSGGTAAMDMMLHLIADRHGAELARGVANQFHHERIRDEQDDQQGGRLEILGAHAAEGAPGDRPDAAPYREPADAAGHRPPRRLEPAPARAAVRCAMPGSRRCATTCSCASSARASC